jgi:hypothetical protein
MKEAAFLTALLIVPTRVRFNSSHQIIKFINLISMLTTGPQQRHRSHWLILNRVPPNCSEYCQITRLCSKFRMETLSSMVQMRQQGCPQSKIPMVVRVSPSLYLNWYDRCDGHCVETDWNVQGLEQCIRIKQCQCTSADIREKAGGSAEHDEGTE